MKIANENEMRELGFKIGKILNGGEIIELVGDLGAGKTTFASGLARGLEIDEKIQSPTFNIVLNYSGRDGIELNHYDFYRLNDAGIMIDEIRESSSNSKNVTLIEWGENVRDFLNEKIIVKIDYLPTDGRNVEFILPENDTKFRKIIEKIEKGKNENLSN